MAKKVQGIIRLQLPAGAANPAPPVGPALGAQGVNIMAFCKDFNAKTKDQNGLILPVVIVATREAIRAIPQMIREGAYACGATTWQVVSDHIVPYSSAGILTGVIIGMARAIGETAPIITVGALTFIAFLPPMPFTGDPVAGPFDWLFAPFTVMPIQMFNWTSRPEAAFLNNAAAAGFILVVMTLAMNGLAIWLRYRLRKNIKW